MARLWIIRRCLADIGLVAHSRCGSRHVGIRIRRALLRWTLRRLIWTCSSKVCIGHSLLVEGRLARVDCVGIKAIVAVCVCLVLIAIVHRTALYSLVSLFFGVCTSSNNSEPGTTASSIRSACSASAHAERRVLQVDADNCIGEQCIFCQGTERWSERKGECVRRR